jgi:hypothetical protein
MMVEKLPHLHGERQLAVSTKLVTYQGLRDCDVAKQLTNESEIAHVTKHLAMKPHAPIALSLGTG